jgi:hypothetical protein
MNATRILLAGIVTFAIASTAKAVNMVWWEAVPNNSDSLVLQQGEGLNLDLQCGQDGAPPPTSCEWEITMYLRNDQGLSIWANDLGTVPDDDSIFVEDFEYMTWYAPPEGPGYYYPFNYVNNAAVAGSGDALLTGTSAFYIGFVGPPPAWYPNGYPLLRFTLSKDGTQGWEPGWTDIHTTIGYLGWDGTPDVFFQFGDNDPIPVGSPGGQSPAGPVISLFNIPEPATIMLLCLGALFLTRRRRPTRTPGPRR